MPYLREIGYASQALHAVALEHPLRQAMRRGSQSRAWCLLAYIGFASSASAQQVGGRLTDAATGAPVAGVVLNLLDSTGVVSAVAVSRPDGRFLIQAPAGGSYGIRALRIGYRPSFLGQISLTSGRSDTLDVALQAVALGLDTVRVVARTECRNVGSASETLAFLVWEQVRAAIQAANVLSHTPLSARLLAFVRNLAPEDGRILDEHVTVLSGNTLRPWGSRDPSEIQRSGYVTTDPNGVTTYYAPDLDVLLSESFVADHCFKVIPSENLSEVSLRFEPVRSRRRIADIAGVITLDPRNAALRRLAFEYTNLPGEITRGTRGATVPGGSLEFNRSGTGQWLITRWELRMPVLASRTIPVGAGRGIRTIRQEVFLSRVRQEGGELALLVAGGDTAWAAEPVRVRGRVRDTDGAAVDGAIVAIGGSDKYAMTDSQGSFNMPALLPGRYGMRVHTPTLQALGASPTTVVDVVRSDTTLLLQIPSSRKQLAKACPGSPSAVAGRVVDSSSVRASSEARAWIEWVQGETVLREVPVSPTGHFRVCGIPFHVPVSVSAGSEASGSPVRRVRVTPDRPVEFVELVVSATASPGRLTGRVLDAARGAPIPFAEITLSGGFGTTVTDSAGEYHLRDLSPGKYSLTMRRIGYSPAEYRVEISPTGVTRRDAFLQRVQVMDTVSVRALGMRTFEENRRVGLGHFLDRTQLARLESQRLAEVVARFPGIMIVRGPGSQAGVASSRGPKSVMAACSILEETSTETCACAPAVYLDKVRLFAGGTGEIPNINRFTVASLEAIEFYEGPSQTPLEYSALNAHCGVVVLHTRRPD